MKITVTDEGAIMVCNDKNQLHSFDDKPAYISSDGELSWYKHDIQHRDNGLPAYTDSTNGIQQWFVNGKFSRPDGLPTEINPNCKEQSKEWHNSSGKIYKYESYGRIVMVDGVSAE